MKRAKDLYPKLISDENLRLAILTVNATHKWHPHHRPNKTVLRVEADIDGYVEKLREIIVNGYDAAPPRIARRWDKSAGKWRDISEPRLWPDQYVHHAVIQVLHVHFFEKYVETGLQRKLKLVVREHTRKEQARWNMCTEPLKSTA